MRFRFTSAGIAHDDGVVQLVSGDRPVPCDIGDPFELKPGYFKQTFQEDPRLMKGELRARTAVRTVAKAHRAASGLGLFGAGMIDRVGTGSDGLLIDIHIAQINRKRGAARNVAADRRVVYPP